MQRHCWTTLQLQNLLCLIIKLLMTSLSNSAIVVVLRMQPRHLIQPREKWSPDHPLPFEGHYLRQKRLRSRSFERHSAKENRIPQQLAINHIKEEGSVIVQASVFLLPPHCVDCACYKSFEGVSIGLPSSVVAAKRTV